MSTDFICKISVGKPKHGNRANFDILFVFINNWEQLLLCFVARIISFLGPHNDALPTARFRSPITVDDKNIKIRME